MMIKLSGGYVSVGHVQTIVPKPDKTDGDSGGCTIWLMDTHTDLDESADVVAARVNEVRAALSALANYAEQSPHDLNAAIALLESIVAKQEAADNGEEKPESERRPNSGRLAESSGGND